MAKQKNKDHKYLVANDADALWGLYVTTIGFQSIRPNINYPPKDHPSAYWFNPSVGRLLHEYQIIYVTRGEGTFQSSSVRSVRVAAGNIILLFPEEWHTFTPLRASGWDAYWIGFNGKNIDQLLSNGFFCRRQPVLDIGFSEQLCGFYEQGIEIANYEKTAFQPMLAGVTHMLLSFIYYAERNNSFRDKDIISKIDQARMMMRNNVLDSQNPEEIALQLNMSYSWFRRIFKQYTGFSPAQYQMEIRLQKAKELLTSTAMAIKEIAYELNFESFSYFVTFFKNRVGISPGEYRNKVHAGEPRLRDQGL